MTLHAIALENNAMDTARALGHYILVTFAADLIRLFLEELAVRSSVRIMTSCALARLHRGVQKLFFQRCFKVLMTIETVFAVSIGFKPEFVLRLCVPGRINEEADKNSPKENA